MQTIMAYYDGKCFVPRGKVDFRRGENVVLTARKTPPAHKGVGAACHIDWSQYNTHTNIWDKDGQECVNEMRANDRQDIC